MDKLYLLTYTKIGWDGLRHAYHAWFAKEPEMKKFIDEMKLEKCGFEIDTAIEIAQFREIAV